MNNKPETWACAEQMFFADEREDTLEIKLDREREEPFPANAPPDRAGKAGWMLGVERACAHTFPRNLKLV